MINSLSRRCDLPVQLFIIVQRVDEPLEGGVLVRDEEQVEAVVAFGHEVEERAVRVGVEVADDDHFHVVLDEAVEHSAREAGGRVPELRGERLLVDGDEVRTALQFDGHEELVGGVLVLEEHVVRVDDGNVEALDGPDVDHGHGKCLTICLKI